jgi:FAD/FMN-containing dehydrogenase
MDARPPGPAIPSEAIEPKERSCHGCGEPPGLAVPEAGLYDEDGRWRLHRTEEGSPIRRGRIEQVRPLTGRSPKAKREELDVQEIGMKSRVRGRVVLPGEEDYDAERTGWNLIVEHRPAMIVVAASPEDVVAAVRYAASADLPVAVQATGHGPSVPADGAVLINTRRMDGLEIDPDAATARLGAGVKGGTVLREAAPHGLAFLVGSTPDVGVVGYLTSGGLRPWAAGGTFPNYLGSGYARPQQVRAAYSDADYGRLAAIKAKYDPRNLFRINHNIPPSS